MKAWGITDIGLVRKENQDAFLIREDMPSRHTVCVVCDGMGGAAGGRLASQIAVESFTYGISTNLPREIHFDGGIDSHGFRILTNDKRIIGPCYITNHKIRIAIDIIVELT